MSLSRIIDISDNEVIDKLRVDNLVIELCLQYLHVVIS